MQCILKCKECNKDFEDFCLNGDELPICPYCEGQVRFVRLNESKKNIEEMFDYLIKNEDED